MSKAKGSARELLAKKSLEAAGFVVTKSGGSLGAADLVALKSGHPPLLVQVKANEGGPFKAFGPAERRELLDQAVKAGAVAELWHWPKARPGSKVATALRIYRASDWPAWG